MSNLGGSRKISIKKAGVLIFSSVVVFTITLSILISLTNPVVVIDDDSGDDDDGGGGGSSGDRDGCGGH